MHHQNISIPNEISNLWPLPDRPNMGAQKGQIYVPQICCNSNKLLNSLGSIIWSTQRRTDLWWAENLTALSPRIQILWDWAIGFRPKPMIVIVQRRIFLMFLVCNSGHSEHFICLVKNLEKKYSKSIYIFISCFMPFWVL